MSLLARHRYLLSRLAEAFGYDDENVLEKLMLAPDVLQAIDHFFSAEGPHKIIIAIGMDADAKDSDGNASRKKLLNAPSDGKRLKVYFDDVDQLPNTAVYFMKNKRDEKDKEGYAIDASKVDDGLLSFGVIRGALESLDALVRCVYRPMIQDMDTETWGEASSEQRNEFLMSVDVFSKGLENSIRNLTGGIELTKYTI